MNQSESPITSPQTNRTTWLVWTWSVVIGPLALVLMVLAINVGGFHRSEASWIAVAWYGSLLTNWLASIKLAWHMTTGHTPLHRVIPFVFLAIALMIGGASILFSISMIGCAGAQAVTK